MREFKVGDKVSFMYDLDGNRAEGIITYDDGDVSSRRPLKVEAVNPSLIDWKHGECLHYTRDGRWSGDVELILIEPEVQNTVDMKNGDRVLVEFEVNVAEDGSYPYRLHFVLDDGSVRENAALSLSADGKYMDTHPSPVKLTVLEQGFRAGDRVKCPLHGEGVVSEIDLDAIFPIGVLFGSKEGWYTLDGRYLLDVNPTLERLEEDV